MKFTHLTSLILGDCSFPGWSILEPEKRMSTNIGWYSKEANSENTILLFHHLTSQLQKFHSKIAEFYQCSSFTIFGETVCIFPQNVAAFIWMRIFIQGFIMVPNLTKISLNIILVRIMGVMITYQALLIVNIIRSDFEPKKGKVARTNIWAESNFSTWHKRSWIDETGFSHSIVIFW